MLDLSVNQSKEPNSGTGVPARARGFFVHYLALTFSTLLSSQVSGAHRAGIFCSGLGQRPTICGLRSSSQIGSSWFVLLGSDFLLHHGRSEPAGLSAHGACAPIRTSRWPVGSSGSAAEDQAILRVPHPAEASYTLRLRRRRVKLAGRVMEASALYSARRGSRIPGATPDCGRRSTTAQRLATVTAPTVRLPRRTIAKRPCSRSAGVSIAS